MVGDVLPQFPLDMMDKNERIRILLTNIQRFSLHDGPGIRTTVFLKGCSLRCPWCSNPENLLPSLQQYTIDGIEGTYGKYMSADELVHECLKDKVYYDGKLNFPENWRITTAADIEKLPGGVTFSGGEALLQMDRLIPVIEVLHGANIHIVVETSLFASPSSVELAINNIDFFYVDMKILEPERCKAVEKGKIEQYLGNLDRLMKSTAPVVIRVPVIGGQTDGDENRRAVKELLLQYKSRVLKIELIKEHNLGKLKYCSLNMEMKYTGVDDSLMEQYKAELEDVGIPVEICKI